MQTVQAHLIKGKKVLLRYDIDVPIQNGVVTDDFRLEAGLPTLKLCLENAQQVILMGHVGRPEGSEKKFSVEPIYHWLVMHGFRSYFESGKLKLLENLRFEPGEDGCDLDYAKELASLGDSPRGEAGFFVNEAFAAYHRAASTTILPRILPHAAGLHFAKEVEKLKQIRENPQKPFVAIIGGVKMEDKLAVIQTLAEIANVVLVGGKLAHQVHEDFFDFPHNVIAAHLTAGGLDISVHTLEAWKPLIMQAKTIVWNGPVGKIEEAKSTKGTRDLAKVILKSDAEIILGGGDTVGFLDKIGLLKKFEEKGLPAARLPAGQGRQGFVSSGGGAMLELFVKGTLDTIEALA